MDKNEQARLVAELRQVSQSLTAIIQRFTEPTRITLEKVRSVLAEKSRSGYTAEVRELLEKHGASKLSEIDPIEYPALLAESEVIGNG